MPAKITDYCTGIANYFSGEVNQLRVEKISSASLPGMINCSNSLHSLSQNDFRLTHRNISRGRKHPLLTRCQRIRCREDHWQHHQQESASLLPVAGERIPAGQGLLPAESVFTPLTTLSAELIKAVMPLISQAALGCGAAMAPGNQALTLFDGAVTRMVHQFLPWTPAAADSSTDATSAPTALSAAQPESPRWRIHQSGNNATQFRQQIDEFLLRINGVADEQLAQQLMAAWWHRDIIFLYPKVYHQPRAERAQEEVMKRWSLMHEMAIRDKTMTDNGTGTRIIIWADEQTQRGYTLFRQGVENYNPLYFLAAGGEAVIGYFATVIGELYRGTLLERLPGESQPYRAQRLMLNWLMPPDPVAAKAFSFKPLKPLSSTGLKAVTRLPGTVMTHPATGMTLHSVLQSEIAGHYWQLYPQGTNLAMAVLPRLQPASGRMATRSQHNLWRIEGIEGEHSFRHGELAQLYIRSGELFYPVTFSVTDGTAELSGGQKIYFHQLSQQWKLLSPDNPHLSSRVLAILPEGLSAEQLGAKRVRVSIGPQNSQLWSEVYSGIQYLEFRQQQESGNEMKTSWLSGRLEGGYFSIARQQSQPIWRQTVLKWQPENHRWLLADSPFAALQRAEENIDLTWLRQITAPREDRVVVHDRPGLYRWGKDYFLRWHTDASGGEWFLPLQPTADGAQYRTPQAGAQGENHFRYQPQSGSWHYLALTSEAFFALPDAVKLHFSPELTSDSELPEYRHLFFRNDEIYLHTGADSEGRAEYIRVEQDADDNDLFRLRASVEGNPDRLWEFRYDDDDEFVPEERQLCQPRVKRADDEPCAGPSGVNRPTGSEREAPEIKRSRLTLQQQIAAQRWLGDQMRTPQELLLATDNRVNRERKNLTYALRLNMRAPENVPISSIAHHSGVSVQRLKAMLGRLSPEACHYLVSYPPQLGESNIAYALRLNRLYSGFTPRIIAEFTRVSESKIITNLNRLAFDEADWLRRHPQHPQESNMDYALRLHQLPQGDTRIPLIARHSGVDETALRQQLKEGIVAAQNWLIRNPPYAGENSMDYAARLYQQPHEKVTVEMIARHAGVEKMSLLQRLGQRMRDKLQQGQENQWLNAHPRHNWETDNAYGLRLVKLRDEQVAAGNLVKKTVRNNIIALHANLSPRTFAVKLHEVKITRQWLNNIPRLPEEELAGVEDTALIMERNKKYALRLLKMRSRHPAKIIKSRAIAAHVGITEPQMNSWLYNAKHMWLNALPRLPNELNFENANEREIQHKNQLYARRMAMQRELEDLFWLISDQHIASQADITLTSLQQAMDPLFVINPWPETAVKNEPMWEPESGLLHLQLKQNPPLLVNPKDPQRSVTREVITGPVTISNIDDVLKRLPKAQRQKVAESLLAKAQELVESDGGRQDFFYDEQGNKQPGLLSDKLEIYHNEQMPELGLQIIAREEIDPFELIGVYTGSWHPDEASLRQECRKMGSQAVHTYLWGIYSGDGSVSAYQNANKLALINTAKLTAEAAPPGEPQNNLAVLYINDVLPGYYTTRKINKGEPLLISYGSYYRADYMIQAALGNDTVRLISREYKCYFVVRGMGDNISAISGPDGLLEALPENAQPYILQEHLDQRGILRYDAIWPKSGRKIAASMENENNLFHAMVKAMHPKGGLDILNEEIAKMKKIVRDEYASEVGSIKTEPAEPPVVISDN